MLVHAARKMRRFVLSLDERIARARALPRSLCNSRVMPGDSAYYEVSVSVGQRTLHFRSPNSPKGLKYTVLTDAFFSLPSFHPRAADGIKKMVPTNTCLYVCIYLQLFLPRLRIITN